MASALEIDGRPESDIPPIVETHLGITQDDAGRPMFQGAVFNSEKRDHVRGILARYMRVPARRRAEYRTQLPAPMPGNVAHANLDVCFKDGIPIVSPKADGTLYALLITTMGDTTLMAFVDRSLKTHVAVADIPTYLRKGTLMFGELVTLTSHGEDAVDRRQVFLIFDIAVHAGTNLTGKCYPERLHMAQRVLMEWPVSRRMVPLRIEPGAPEIQRTVDLRIKPIGMMQTDEFPTDGVILVHPRQNLTAGRQHRLWRIKERDTADLLWDPTAGIWCITSAQSLIALPEFVHVDVEGATELLRAKLTGSTSPIVVECLVTRHRPNKKKRVSLRCLPHVIRIDKTRPNDLSTINELRHESPSMSDLYARLEQLTST